MDALFDDAGRMAGLADDETYAFSHYMMLCDARLNLISIFDDLKYDRSDIDILSPGMRRHVVQQLAPLGFKQTSGNVLRNKAQDIFCYLPKSHALGASPFDITRYTPKRPRDYYILTPTQTACQIIDTYPLESAVERIEALVQVQPVNLFKLKDYLERTPTHRNFAKFIGHLAAVQKEAVASGPLSRRRALN